MLSGIYYSQNYASIIRPTLKNSVQCYQTDFSSDFFRQGGSGAEEDRVGLKAGTENEEMRNEEMRKWKHLCVQKELCVKIDWQSRRPGFMILVFS